MEFVYLLVEKREGFECFIYGVYKTVELAMEAKAGSLKDNPNAPMYVMKWCVIGSQNQPKEVGQIVWN